MDLRHAIAAIYHWRWLMVLSLLFGFGLAAAYAAVTPREYSATTSVFFSLNRSTTVTDAAQGSTYTQDVVQSYTQVVTLPLVLNPVISSLGLDETPTELARRITVESQPDTVLAKITVTDPDPDQAAKIANSIATQLAQAVVTLTPGGASGAAAIRVTTLSVATAPRLPSAPNVPLLLVVGLAAGLLLGIALAVIRELVASPLITVEAAEKVAPVIGRIVRDPKANTHRLPVSTHPQLPTAESFRGLRTNLQRFEAAAEGSACYVVTSPLPREGRTRVAVNLAIALSLSFRNVLLIDADMRRPAVAPLLGLEGEPGLSDVLRGEAALDDVVKTWQTQSWRDSSLSVLPAGQRVIEPSELLSQAAMDDLLETVRTKYDVVILDSPPLMPVTDAALLAGRTDGVLFVVNARSTCERDFLESVHALEMAGATILGVVFNSVRLSRRKRFGSRVYDPRTHIWKR